MNPGGAAPVSLWPHWMMSAAQCSATVLSQSDLVISMCDSSSVHAIAIKQEKNCKLKEALSIDACSSFSPRPKRRGVDPFIHRISFCVELSADRRHVL